MEPERLLHHIGGLLWPWGLWGPVLAVAPLGLAVRSGRWNSSVGLMAAKVPGSCSLQLWMPTHGD